MKRLILISMMLLAGTVSIAKAQCVVPPGFVCITQAAANETATRLAELIETRKALAEALKERALTDVERATSQRLTDRLNQIIALGDQISERQNKVIEQLYQAVEKALDLVTKLEEKINKPKGFWDKFLDVLETAAKIALGIIIGSAL